MARILIVDDEPALRDSLQRTLEREGHEIRAVADLRSGRREVAAGEFDLLLSDIRLTDGSGLDLIAEARQAHPTLRIVALTAFGSVELAVEAMRRGADDFLEKPFRADVLMSRLERALEPARLGGSGCPARARERGPARGAEGGRARNAPRRLVGVPLAPAPAHRPCGPERRQRPHRRRDGHRQGARRPSPPLGEPAGEGTVHRVQLRRRGRGTGRERAPRPREGLLHRRRPAAARSFRARRRRHALPRRGGRDGPAFAGEACCARSRSVASSASEA